MLKMFSSLSVFIFTSVVFVTGQETFEEYYNDISRRIEQTKQYTLPKNNEELYRTTDSKAYDYGKWDFIIVGEGSAGTALANRLSEIGQWKILLLEAGGAETPLSDIPGLNWYTIRSPMNWGYYTTPQKTCCQGMINRQCTYPRGKALGGSSTVNALIYARGSPLDFDSWERMGNSGWSYADMLRYFIKSEDADIEDGDSGYHGYDGFLHTNYSSPPSIISDAYFKANAEMGIEELDYNGKTQFGVSNIQFNINFNKRDDGGHAYIDPIRSRRNLNVTLNAFVTKVKICGDVAKGVHFIKNGIQYIAHANKEVILSAGSINSPQLLMLSGIGPRNELKKFKIPVKSDLPVGQNMEDHVMYINLYVRTNKAAETRTLRENLQRYLRGETPLTYGAGCEHISFVNTKTSDQLPPDIEYLTVPPSGGKPVDSKFFYNFNDETLKGLEHVNSSTDLRILVVLLKPKSRGSVTLQSSSPVDFPLIDVNYFSDVKNQDIETLYQGIEFILKLTQTKAFQDIGASIVDTVTGCDNFRKNSRDYWYCGIRKTSSTIYHPTGTTRMGSRTSNSVVSSSLLVHGMKNLRVIDAGVMPEIVSGHPNAAVFAIAEKGADIIKERYGLRGTL